MDVVATLRTAVRLHQQGRLADAEQLYQSILVKQPQHFDALHFLGVLLLQQQRTQQAVDLISAAVRVQPSSLEAQSNLAAAYATLKRYPDALQALDRIIAQRPKDTDALYNRAAVLDAASRREEAVATYRKVLELKPDHVAALFGAGNALAAMDRFEEALSYFDKALAIAPGQLDILNNRAAALGKLNRSEEVLRACEQILAIKPDHVLALNNYGNALCKLHRFKEALAAIDKALAIAPGYAEAITNRGTVLIKLRRFEEAAAAYRQCLAIDATAEAHRNYALALLEMRQYEAALEHGAKALALRPAYPEMLRDRAGSLEMLGRLDEALSALDAALELSPNYTDALVNRAWILGLKNQTAEAIAAGQKALALEPTDPPVVEKLTQLLTDQYGHACDWTNTRAMADRLRERVSRGQTVPPSTLVRLTDDPGILLQSAIGVIQEYVVGAAPFTHVRPRHTGKLRLGYISQDFRRHVTGSGVAEMLEKHDKSRFELFGFSLAQDDGSALRKRIAATFDHFHDMSRLGDEAAARRIYDLEIDVLVELVPHSDGYRPRIVAQRPAPIQVNAWSLGCSGGGTFYDYVLGDQWSLPFAAQPFYLEKIVHLPHTCFPFDSTQQISSRTPDRSEEGLPEQGLVFCCFNANYKISRDVFRVWMSLLHKVEGSVLWLARNNDLAVANLRAAATELGIDPSRLIFSTRKPAMADHLARHRLADLFLDTVPYNAQTTAMDALWAGLPVLTCVGRSYVGRLATSQLHGIGLPELVTDDLNAYERLALDLARDPERLARLKAKVESNRLTFPLFDMTRLCRELEGAYATMFDIWRRGESPRSFTVDDAPASAAAS